MDNAQFAALLSVLGVFGASLVGVIKWSVTRLTGALDGNTKAHLESVKAMTEMSTKLDFVYNQANAVREFVTEERSGVHDVPDESKKKTPAMGVKKG